MEEVKDDVQVVQMKKQLPNETVMMTDTDKTIIWPYGNLIYKCSCGGRQVLEEMVSSGIKITLVPSPSSWMTFSCLDCKTTSTLLFEEYKKNEDDNKANKEREYIPGISADTESILTLVN